jgi:mRNA-degrading endonuclease HigB of HigAB toxin-antitoxin module
MLFSKSRTIMQLYGTIILDEFTAAYPDCRGHVAAWRVEVEEATWTTSQHLQERHITAQIAKGGRVVFRLLKGLYMLDTKVKFDRGVVLVEKAWVDGQPAKAATRASKK